MVFILFLWYISVTPMKFRHLISNTIKERYIGYMDSWFVVYAFHKFTNIRDKSKPFRGIQKPIKLLHKMPQSLSYFF